MKIIISPAKKMVQDENSMAVSDAPSFTKQDSSDDTLVFLKEVNQRKKLR